MDALELIAYSLAKGHPMVGHANCRDAYLIADTFDFEYCQDRKDDADDFAMRSDLQLCFMDRHDILGDGLSRTTYSNGARLYVNYADEPKSADGIAVPARDYVVVR